jgi:hypothetical protein
MEFVAEFGIARAYLARYAAVLAVRSAIQGRGKRLLRVSDFHVFFLVIHFFVCFLFFKLN